MDIVKLAELFKATLDVNQLEQAEKQLEQVHKIIGFLPTVLQVVMESSIELPTRQAAAIYFKNQALTYWQSKDSKSNGQLQYSIHEQDKALIRNSIVDALVLANDAIRTSLSSSLHVIIKNDFPERWTGIVDKIVVYLQTTEPNNWMGALIAMLQLVKIYEYKNNVEKAPLLDAMKLLGPIIYKMMLDLFPDNSEHSVLMQKIILKIIFTLTQYSLPLSFFTHEFFTQWMEIFRQVLDRPVPNEVNNVDVEERYELPWYKAKKWAIHILARIFDRYGSPKTAQSEYKSFASWYLKTFSQGIIQVILKMLEQYSQSVYLPPRVVQQCVNYLNTAVEHLETWKILKPNIFPLIEKIIFPLMCYTDEDDELWKTDPQEYIRRKFDFYEDSISPVNAAQGFLNICCKKRKDMLKNTISFAVQVLSTETSWPRQKDGALHMLGAVSDLLLRKKVYHHQINEMLSHYVFPFFNCEYPFLRARAAWVLHFFEDFDFENDATLNQALTCLQTALLQDKELPVKVQASISLHIFIINQEKAKQFVEPNLNTIIIQYLNIVKESQNDDVTNALQKIILAYGDKVIPISVQIIENLVDTIDETNTMTAMGILAAIDTVLMMIESKEVLEKVEPAALKSVFFVINKNLTELYEECFNIITSLTEKFISNDMWKLYEFMYKIVTEDTGVDYFTDMMSPLHNFITVDPDAFISNPNRIVALYEICKYVVNYEFIEDVHCNVVKIIEVFFLQFREKIEEYIPSFVEIVLSRFMKDIKTEELHTMCIQVLIVVFYINSDLLFQILTKLQPIYPNTPLIDHFFKQWLKNINSFFGLHDRKVCILGLAKLICLEPNKRPQIVNEMSGKLLPEMLKLFVNLKDAYKAKANAEIESSDDDTDFDTEDDDDDEIDEEENVKDNIVRQLRSNLEFNVTEMDDDSYDSDEDESEIEEDDNELTTLESFETSIDKEDSQDDEYIIFRKCVEAIKEQDPNWYTLLFGHLGESEVSTLNDVFLLAQRRKDAAESRQIEKGGGYMFDNQTIPTSFNFGGSFS